MPVTLPAQSPPDATEPDSTRPEATGPDFGDPAIAGPDRSAPDIFASNISGPGVSAPDTSGPDISQLNVSQLDVSQPDVSEPEVSGPNISAPAREPSGRGVASPAALVAVVAVSALVIILCVLGAFMSGLFGFLTNTEAATENLPTTTALGPSARVALTSFDDGEWLVGTDLVAGTYATTVPASSTGCTWERKDAADGTASSVLESGVGKAGDRLVVDIRTTDKVFHARGCGLWQRAAE